MAVKSWKGKNAPLMVVGAFGEGKEKPELTLHGVLLMIPTWCSNHVCFALQRENESILVLPRAYSRMENKPICSSASGETNV